MAERYPELRDKPDGCRALAEVLRQTGDVDQADQLVPWADNLDAGDVW